MLEVNAPHTQGLSPRNRAAASRRTHVDRGRFHDAITSPGWTSRSRGLYAHAHRA